MQKRQINPFNFAMAICFLMIFHRQLIGQFDNSGFNERKQAWLNRNGEAIEGGYDTRVFFGHPYLFAWLEKNIFISEPHPELGTFHDQLVAMYDPRSVEGCRTGLHLARIFYQYGHILTESSYPYPNDWQAIKNLMSVDARDNSHLNTRGWDKSTQPQRTVTAFLYTLEYDRDAKVLWPTGTYDDIQFTSSYSGKTYVPGNYYSVYELSRDWLFQAFDTWTKQGSVELDGCYVSLALHSLLLLYDFAARPLERLGGRPDPDGIEMKKRAKMTLDLLFLDQIMDFSANHHGGALGRIYRFCIVHGLFRALYYAYFGFNTGCTTDDGDAYVSSYRLPDLIQDLGIVTEEPAGYWHIHQENNRANPDIRFGKWTFITKYFNLGGNAPNGEGWQLAIHSTDEKGPRPGQPFRLWIDHVPSAADPNENLDPTTWMGNGCIYQYRNAVFFNLWDGGHVHVCQDGNSFDIGQDQLKRASQYVQDYSLESGWNFFREENVAIALRLDDGKTGAMEVVIIDPSVNADHCYPSFQEFKTTVINQCEINNYSYRTSRGHLIEADDNGGKVQGRPIWSFPFKRMETIDDRGHKLISWNNDVMTVSKNNKTIIYDFNNWEYYDSGGHADIIPPSPPNNIAVSIKGGNN